MIVLDEIRPRNSNMSMINDRYVCMVDPALIKQGEVWVRRALGSIVVIKQEGGSEGVEVGKEEATKYASHGQESRVVSRRLRQKSTKNIKIHSTK